MNQRHAILLAALLTRSFGAPEAAAAPISGVSTSTVTSAVSFVTTGTLTSPRAGHSATLLPDGEVLVAGGFDGTNWLATAELFDPATGTWTETGSLRTARNVHTATLLPNGKVLVAGGNTSGYNSLNSSELYDPATGRWANTGALLNARGYQTATLLPNGLVLVAGGANDSSHETLSSAELYNPANGTWTETGPLGTERAYHTATLLPDWKVLVCGGGHDGSPNATISSSELYDPATGRWSNTGALFTARSHHTATLLSNGSVLVVGGVDPLGPNGTASSAELYHPTVGAWVPTAPMPCGRYGHRATVLLDGDVLVIGGANGSTYLATAELYDPPSGNWKPAGSMKEARVAHTVTLLRNGAALVVAGVDLAQPKWLSSAELFGPPDSSLKLITLNRAVKLPNDAVQFTFTNTPAAEASVYGATNLSTPFSQWDLVGTPKEVSPGQFQFTDPQAPNRPQRFYRVCSN